MNQWVLFFLAFATAADLSAQTNTRVRLALVSETDEASTAADVLTAQLSNNEKIQLLERNEIEKVYREQGMSAANRDDLKLGRILGADGLLLLNVVRATQATNLTARLIAIKPGVVLTDGSFPWPLKDTPQWADSVATYLNSFLPKLTVLAKDAIPISIVNLRAAISSADEQETERDLKLLTIQRLSQEPRFFVLERQKMQLLSEEKELNSDESTFWNGSYLLDGIVDQNGYSKETVTINVRLTPKKGGAALTFEVDGSRTNLAEVVNRLAVEVTGLLKVNPTVKEWNASDEAAQYFDEAKWALRWGVYPEAQGAADSAWALGKRDVECASVRVKAYVLQVAANAVGYQQGEMSYGCLGGYDSNNRPLGPPASKATVQAQIKQIVAEYPNGVRGKTNFVASQNLWVFDYVFAGKLPDPKNIEYALRALELYYQFSRNSPDDLLQAGSQETRWKNSEWYNLGIQDLSAASTVLQDFNFVPQPQNAVADELADLRARARSVADWISQSPGVRDSYFVGDRIATRDGLIYTIGEEDPRNLNLFNCEVKWGCFWQERPEETIELYRKLMSSPVFCYIHKHLWIRPLERPRLVAWNKADAARLPVVWNSFLRELGDSTNIFLQLEAKAFQLADAKDDDQVSAAFTNLFNGLLANRDALVACNVEVLYLEWGTGELVSARTGNGIVTDTRQSLGRLFYSEYSPKLQAMDQEYWNKTVPARQFQTAFEKQKQYLKENRPYDFQDFVNIFLVGAPNYSKAQALEIMPLLEAYKSNLVVQSSSATGIQKGKLMGAIAQVGFVADRVNQVLHPVASTPLKTGPVKIHPAVPFGAGAARALPASSEAPAEVVANIMPVNRFLKIPVDRLQGNDVSGFHIFAERWCEGRLLIALTYSEMVYEFDSQGNWKSTSYKSPVAFALFNPDTGDWDMVKGPDISETDLNILRIQGDNHRMILFQGNLFFCQEGQLQKFDLQRRQWEDLGIPGQGSHDLFCAAGHLFLTDANAILEIADDGKGTRILASTRRHPAESALDSLDTLGFRSPFAGGMPSPPELFSGPDHSICANIGNKVFSWTGQDWHEVLNLNFSQPPEIFEDGIIFRSVPSRSADDPACLWIWDNRQSAPELVLADKPLPHPGIINSPLHKPNDEILHSVWRSIAYDYLTRSAVTVFKSNLYFFVEHAGVSNVNGHWTATEKDGYHAKLVCLSRDSEEPIIVPLKFDVTLGLPPLKSLNERHEPWLAMDPLLSAPIIYFARDKLFLSQRNTPGVWVIPVTEIESAIASQKQTQMAQIAENQKRALAAKEEHRKDLAQQHKGLLAKYDRNRNGTLDLEEREAALEDSTFIESELDSIDANHNNRLDPRELIWFDANRNGVLDPPEATGINNAQKLLAEKLIKEFDQDGDGQLDQNEFANAVSSDPHSGRPGGLSRMNFSLHDRNHDDKLDADELELFLEQQTTQDVRRETFGKQPGAIHGLMTQPQPAFKQVLEIYWKGPDTDVSHLSTLKQNDGTQSNSPPNQ